MLNDSQIHENADPRNPNAAAEPKVPFAVRHPYVAAGGQLAITGLVYAAGIAAATTIVTLVQHGLSKMLKPAPIPAADPSAPAA